MDFLVDITEVYTYHITNAESLINAQLSQTAYIPNLK